MLLSYSVLQYLQTDHFQDLQPHLSCDQTNHESRTSDFRDIFVGFVVSKSFPIKSCILWSLIWDMFGTREISTHDWHIRSLHPLKVSMQPWYVMIFHENHLPNRKLILETSPQPKKHVPWGKLTLGISDRFCGASWMRGAAGLGAAHRCETSTICRSVS